MSPKKGRPLLGEVGKTERFEIRLTKQTSEKLKVCAERLQISRAQVIERGIDMVDEATKSENNS